MRMTDFAVRENFFTDLPRSVPYDDMPLDTDGKRQRIVPLNQVIHFHTYKIV